MTRKDLAELIFPEIKETIEDLEKRYPLRNLPEGAEVTRFAPSPTGFLHTGSLFTSFISNKVAKQSNGIFFFRLEDTDTKREIKGSEKDLLNQLNVFGINADEGLTLNGEVGNYGPYTQSKRADIYKTVIKQMIIDDLAYPCFCTKEELEALREEQEAKKIIPGYYQEFAKCRNLTVDEAINKIKEGIPYVIRFKSHGDHNHKIKVHDEIRGNLELTENDQDIVILKGDGLPTYHFAHAVDDHFMRTTVVTRGEEWLPSLPIHLELFDSLGFKRVKYAHLPVIMKIDEENGNRRKLSKRKDPEAAVSYFLSDGYATKPILTYLMTIANSNFEEYLIQNKDGDYNSFKFSFNKMSLDGALFDIEKLRYFGREYLSKLNKDEFYNQAINYANQYDSNLATLINSDIEFFKNFINIDREKDNPRKDYAYFKELYNMTYMYHDNYISIIKDPLYKFESKVTNIQLIIDFLTDVKDNLKFIGLDESGWFNALKEIAVKYNFAINNKEYKANPELFTGNMADASGLYRIAITSKSNTPSLFTIMNLLGEAEVNERINSFINYLKTLNN